jgi:hypothetical protein
MTGEWQASIQGLKHMAKGSATGNPVIPTAVTGKSGLGLHLRISNSDAGGVLLLRTVIPLRVPAHNGEKQ